MNFACNPLHARSWFNWREPIALGISVFFFAVIFLGVWSWFDALVTGLVIGSVVAFLVKFFWLDKMVLVIKCPKCGEFIELDTPWLCGYKVDEVEHENVNTSEYPFVNECEVCHKRPKAYQCHHCEELELIFLSADHDKRNYAKRLGNIESRIDPHAVTVTQKLEKIQVKALDYEVAKLDRKIKIESEFPEQSEERLEEKEIQAAYLAIQTFALTKRSTDEAVDRLKAKGAEDFKNDPLKKAKNDLAIDEGARRYRLDVNRITK
jgi:hypothetical protein